MSFTATWTPEGTSSTRPTCTESGETRASWARPSPGQRDRVVLATKFGNVRGPNGEFLGVRGDPTYVKECCEASLKRLGVDVIDPVLPAPGRSQDADRGDCRGDGRAGDRGQGAVPRAVGSRAGNHQTSGGGSLDRGPSDGILALDPRGPKPRSCRRSETWELASSLIARSAEGS